MENDRRFKSIIEVAKICGVSRRTIYTWMKDELLTIYRLPSGQVRLDIRELLKVERTNRNRESFFGKLEKGACVMYGKDTETVQRISEKNVEEAFQYQPWNDEQVKAGAIIRETLVVAAKMIISNVPETPLRTRALNALVDARMLANAAITFNGKF